MARLASDSKMGFYPTSITTIQKVINKTINFKEDKVVYAIDSCAGEGEAIEMIGKEYNCKTFAVELNEDRAKEASKRDINKVLNADALSGIYKSNHWAGLNFLNPPYGTNSDSGRLELDFIQRWGVVTTIGGVLILVINPSSADEDMAKTLRLQGYRPMFSFYDPDNEDYKKFGQFFMVFQQQLPNFRASLEKFYSLFENPLNINSDLEIEKIDIRLGFEPQNFREVITPRWKIEESLKKSNLNNLFFQELRHHGLRTKSIEHPNEGQSAILIASGVLNQELTLANGDRVILKGTSTKYQRQMEEMNEDGNIDKVKLVDNYKTVVYGLDLTHGQFVKFE